ncbi:hypothetical protein OR221_0837 [Microbacterium laevaniformans OR221]|nr:hypothetical protein OR221_0837 [Microbacterium laevaniformans OR221]
MTDRDWMKLIDRKAALREQFPTLAQVRKERPGTTADRARNDYYHAENHASQQAHQHRLWEQSIEHNTTLQARREQRARNREYKNRNKESAA